MNKLLISVVMVLGFSDISNGQDINYRPYISTRLAKTVMTYSPQDKKEMCDGSGWITHGDGHKTECPGCSKCEAIETESTQDAVQECVPARTKGIFRRIFGR